MKDAPARVLLVDDDAILLDALSQMLSLRFDAIEVDTCQSGREVLERVALHQYDCIISDIKMPGMDGLELLDRIQELAADVPVVLITGHGETDLAIKALRARAYDFVQKPIDRDYFIASVTRAIELRRLRSEVQRRQEALERYTEELEQRVQERTAELTKANRAKDEFLGLVSHELKTPLAVMIGAAELLYKRADSIPDREKTELLFTLREEGWRLNRIIENLLVLGRAELGIEPVVQPVDMARLIENQVARHRQFYPQRPIGIVLAPSQVMVECEPTYLELVVTNLLSNAEKYSEPQQPIEIRLDVRDGEVCVAVMDRGRGITNEEAELLFQPFYRSQSVPEHVSGVGIGLAVCKRLIELQAGAIEAAPRDGGGSKFTFRVPALTSASAPRDTTGKSPTKSTSRR